MYFYCNRVLKAFRRERERERERLQQCYTKEIRELQFLTIELCFLCQLNIMPRWESRILILVSLCIDIFYLYTLYRNNQSLEYNTNLIRLTSKYNTTLLYSIFQGRRFYKLVWFLPSFLDPHQKLTTTQVCQTPNFIFYVFWNHQP